MRAAAVNSIFCFFLLGDGEEDADVVVSVGGGGGSWAVVGEEASAEVLEAESGAESNLARRFRRSSAEDEGELLGEVESLSMILIFAKIFELLKMGGRES